MTATATLLRKTATRFLDEFTIVEIANGTPEPDITRCKTVEGIAIVLRRHYPDKKIHQAERTVTVLEEDGETVLLKVIQKSERTVVG